MRKIILSGLYVALFLSGTFICARDPAPSEEDLKIAHPEQTNYSPYARVIEIPTPRWTLYDKVRLGAKVPQGVPMTTQERAYTSPIWYTPK